MRLARTAAAAGIIAASCFAAGLLIEAMAHSALYPPFPEIRRIADGLRRLLTAADHGDDALEHHKSTFVTLRSRTVDIPEAPREGAGGAIATIGEDTLVLRFDGAVFAVRADDTVARTAITLPDNGYDAWAATLSQTPYDGLVNFPGSFRYNDLAYQEGPRGPQLWLSYTEWNAQRACYTTTLARAALARPKPASSQIRIGAEDWRTVLRTAPCLPLSESVSAFYGSAAAGRLAFSHDGTKAYLASGDYRWDHANEDGSQLAQVLAQAPGADYGKIIEIDLETETARHLSRGHRNPQGITVDAASRLWVVEHGPRGGDELNLIRDGKNYGWPLETYGSGYDGKPVPGSISIGRHETYEKPVFAWLPSLGTSALIQVEGFHPSWDGDLLAATLRARMLVRIRLDGERVVFAERIEIERRIRDLAQLADGSLALWTDDSKLLLLTAAPDAS